jgi:hypothetical protein
VRLCWDNVVLMERIVLCQSPPPLSRVTESEVDDLHPSAEAAGKGNLGGAITLAREGDRAHCDEQAIRLIRSGRASGKGAR